MAIPEPRSTPHDGEAATFVHAFAEFWRAPSVARFGQLMHPEVRLVQPMAPPAVGVDEACAWCEAMLGLLPDLRIEVTRWSGTPEALFIEWTATGTFHGKAVRWHAVDRFRLQEGLVRERVAYFDPLPILSVIARTPSGWLAVAGSLLGQRRRARGGAR